MSEYIEVIEKWIAIEKFPIEKTKEFFEKVWKANFYKHWKWFDTLDCRVSSSRQFNQDMTINKYISLITNASHKYMIVGRYDSNYFKSPKQKELRNEWHIVTELGIRTSDLKDFQIDHFLHYFCPNTPKNYERLSFMFKETYGKNIDDCVKNTVRYNKLK